MNGSQWKQQPAILLTNSAQTPSFFRSCIPFKKRSVCVHVLACGPSCSKVLPLKVYSLVLAEGLMSNLLHSRPKSPSCWDSQQGPFHQSLQGQGAPLIGARTQRSLQGHHEYFWKQRRIPCVVPWTRSDGPWKPAPCLHRRSFPAGRWWWHAPPLWLRGFSCRPCDSNLFKSWVQRAHAKVDNSQTAAGEITSHHSWDMGDFTCESIVHAGSQLSMWQLEKKPKQAPALSNQNRIHIQ